MEEGHRAGGGLNDQSVTLRQRAERRAIASNLCVAVRAIEQPHFDDGIAADHDGPIRQRMRADRCEHHRIQPGIENRAAARERMTDVIPPGVDASDKEEGREGGTVHKAIEVLMGEHRLIEQALGSLETYAGTVRAGAHGRSRGPRAADR